MYVQPSTGPNGVKFGLGLHYVYMSSQCFASPVMRQGPKSHVLAHLFILTCILLLNTGLDKQNFSAYHCKYFLTHQL